ncbi:hypothetical protein BJX66DRAFT_319122 [Aspergillus keveii]|uniref:Secreted protein n=1 Tax=Aspergillus keveii TaxID=714993 RepID=A0ABR4FIP2_9EURO
MAATCAGSGGSYLIWLIIPLLAGLASGPGPSSAKPNPNAGLVGGGVAGCSGVGAASSLTLTLRGGCLAVLTACKPLVTLAASSSSSSSASACQLGLHWSHACSASWPASPHCCRWYPSTIPSKYSSKTTRRHPPSPVMYLCTNCSSSV